MAAAGLCSSANAEQEHDHKHPPSQPSPGLVEHPHDHHANHDHKDDTDDHQSDGLFGIKSTALDWSHGEDVNMGGIFFPELFFQGIFGDSSADPASLAVGHHDPQTQAMLQSVHFAGFLKVDDYLTGFVNYEGTTDANDKYAGVIEEAFAHLHLLDSLAIGGGQFLNSFGFQNQRHLHAWDFVDQNLVNGRMLNEGELTTRGGEIIIDLPTRWQSSLTLAGGGLATHDEGGHEHGHGAEIDGHQPNFDADDANFDAWVVSANYQADYGSHEHMKGTLSAAVGENGFGKLTQVYGVGHEIVWNQLQPLYDDTKNTVIGEYRGGSFGAGSIRWRTEAMLRHIDAYAGSTQNHRATHARGHGDQAKDRHQDRPRRASLDEFGFYSVVQYGLSQLTTTGLRGEWVSGIDDLGLEERWRVSPTVGMYLNNRRSVHLRLQYNYDFAESYRDEHSIWLQVSVAWGAAGDHLHHHH